MDANGPYLDRAFINEDLSIVVSMDSTVTSLTGVGLQYRLWTVDPAIVTANPSTTVAVTYTVGANLAVNTTTLVVTVTLPTSTANTGGTPLPAGKYKWELFRTDVASKSVLCYGDLNLLFRP